MPKVAIVSTPVDYADVEAAVRRAVDLCGGTDVIKNGGGRILVKPNLVETNDGESGNTTDKRVIGELVKMALASGAEVTVGDSGGTRWHGATELALKETGLRDYCERLGAEVVSFDKTEPVKVDIPQKEVLKEAYLASPAIEASLIINAPKMKTHILTKTTGAVKNLYGCVPGGLKSVYHKVGGDAVRFAALLNDIYAALTPGLTVMDGVVGLGGQWRLQDRIYPGVILAGTDGVAVDAVAAQILGFDPWRVPTLANAHRRGLGVADPDKITVVGEPLAAIVSAVAKKTKRWRVPSFGGSVGGWALGKESPELIEDACSGCGHCPQACPVEAVALRNGRPEFDLDKCIRCFCCAELCPERAIRLTRGRFLNLFLKR